MLSARSTNGREIFIVGLGLLFITCIFFWRVILLGEATIPADILQEWHPWKSYIQDAQPAPNDYLGDDILYFYPLRLSVYKMIKGGQVPLWHPHLFCGMPLLANIESMIFSPFSLIFYIFPFKMAFGYSNIIQLFLAGLFMYLFSRSLKIGSFGSFVASLVFMFNGFFIVWLEDQNPVSTGLWLPLILLLLEKMLLSPRIFFAIVIGIIIALQFLCGHIQTSLYIFLAVVIYALVRILQYGPSSREKMKYPLRIFSLLGVAFAVGFGLAAIQLVPFFELVSLCHRIGDVFKYKFCLISIDIALHLLTFVVPDIYGNVKTYWGANNYAELCGYIGILPLILAVFAVSRKKIRKNKTVAPFLVLAVFSLLVYLRTPFLALLHFIPYYSSALSSSRIIFLYVFAASILAGFGADYLSKREDMRFEIRRFTKVIARYLFIGMILILAGHIILQISKEHSITHGMSAAAQGFFKKFHIGYMPYRDYLKHYNIRSPLSIIYLPFLFGFMVVVTFNLYSKAGPSIFFKTFLCFMIVIDLFYFGMQYITTAKQETIYPEVEIVRFLKNDSSVWRAISLGEAFPPNSMAPYEIQSANGMWPLLLKRYAEFGSLIDENLWEQSPFPYRICLSSIDSSLINLLNIKYLLTTGKIEKNKIKYKLIYDNGGMKIYENTKALARAFLVPETIVIRDKNEILRYLSSDDFEPARRVVLEEEPDDIDREKGTSGKGQEKEKVAITKYSPNGIVMEVSIDSPKFLVLSDSYYPGWKVYVDGKEGKIFQANYIMRAVYLTKGPHIVDFVYDPASFRIGRDVTFLSLVAVALFLAVHFVKQSTLRRA